MFYNVARFAAVVAVTSLFAQGVSATVSHPKIHTPSVKTEVVPDSYIVVYMRNVSMGAMAGHLKTVTTLLESKKRDLRLGIAATYNFNT
jgi:hypothetical protein